jgi:hypothetical protein
MGRRSSIALWLSVPGLLAACALLSATPQVTPGPPSSSSASDLRTFDEGGLTFAYPGAWQELHFTVDSSFSHLIAVLATIPVPTPCATAVTASFTEIDCTAHFQLVPHSVVVQVQEGGMPGFDISHVPDGASPMTVDGQPAYLRDTSGPALTTDEPPVGADLVRTWTLSNPGALDNYFEIDAFIRGPNLGSIEEALASLVASLRYDPPATPTPTTRDGQTPAPIASVGSTSQLRVGLDLVRQSMPPGIDCTCPDFTSYVVRLTTTGGKEVASWNLRDPAGLEQVLDPGSYSVIVSRVVVADNVDTGARTTSAPLAQCSTDLSLAAGTTTSVTATFGLDAAACKFNAPLITGP